MQEQKVIAANKMLGPGKNGTAIISRKKTIIDRRHKTLKDIQSILKRLAHYKAERSVVEVREIIGHKKYFRTLNRNISAQKIIFTPKASST